MEPIYQEIRDFCVAEYNREWGGRIFATYLRLEIDDTIGRNASSSY